jgi:hypothetical protein
VAHPVRLDHCVIAVSDWDGSKDRDGSLLEFISYTSV